MLLIITPLRGWRRQIQVYQFIDATEADVFQALQAVNEDFQERGKRHEVNITIAHITADQLGAWIDNNIEPNWWESLSRKVRYTITTLARP